MNSKYVQLHRASAERLFEEMQAGKPSIQSQDLLRMAIAHSPPDKPEALRDWTYCADAMPSEPDASINFEEDMCLVTDGYTTGVCGWQRGHGCGKPWASWGAYGDIPPEKIIAWILYPAPALPRVVVVKVDKDAVPAGRDPDMWLAQSCDSPQVGSALWKAPGEGDAAFKERVQAGLGRSRDSPRLPYTSEAGKEWEKGRREFASGASKRYDVPKPVPDFEDNMKKAADQVNEAWANVGKAWIDKL